MLPIRRVVDNPQYQETYATVAREYLAVFLTSTLNLSLSENMSTSMFALNAACTILTACGTVGAVTHQNNQLTQEEERAFNNLNTVQQHFKVAFDMFSDGARNIAECATSVLRIR